MEAVRKEYNPHLGYVDDIIRQYAGLVYKIANRFRWAIVRHSSIQLDDLISEGNIGLIKAFQNFDPDAFINVSKFTTYAFPMIYGEIRRFLRDRAPEVKVPSSTYALAGAIIRERLEAESASEIVSRIGCSLNEAERTVQYIRNTNVLYLDQELSEDGLTRLDMTGKAEDHSQVEVIEFLGTLTKREREIVELRQSGLKQTEIAERIGLTQLSTRRCLVRIGVKMNQYFDLKLKNKEIESEVRTMDELTRDKYSALKKQGMSDEDIRKQYPMSSSRLHRMKKSWNVPMKSYKGAVNSNQSVKALATAPKPDDPKAEQPVASPEIDTDQTRKAVGELLEKCQGYLAETEAVKERLAVLERENELLKALLKNYL